MSNHKIRVLVFTAVFWGFSGTAFANSATLGSITAQRSMLEDLNLQVQIQEQSQKLNQLLMPVIQPLPAQPGELTAKQLLDKLEVPENEGNNSEAKPEEDNRNSKVIAIYTNNKVLKAKIKYKGKTETVSNGQKLNGQKVQIYRDRVVVGNKTLEL